MSSSQDVSSQSTDSKSQLIIKIMAFSCAVVGLGCLWFIIQLIGVTFLSMLSVVTFVSLIGLCFWGIKSQLHLQHHPHNRSKDNHLHAQQSQPAASTLNQQRSQENLHQNPLFKPLAQLTLANKQLLLETCVNPQQLIATKQTFEQCCAWQFNDPESFAALNLCQDVEFITSLNLLTGKAQYKSDKDKQNINKAWQQLLDANSSIDNHQNSGQVFGCQYDVVDDKGKTINVIETWVLAEHQQCVWYRAIGLGAGNFQQQTGQVNAGSSGQMVIESGKMDALVRFADGITHDYNNLFGIVNGYTELMTGILDDPKKINDYVEQIQSASTRAQALGDQILALSRRRKAGMELVDFEQIMIEPLFIFKKNLPDTVKFDWVLGKSHHQIKLDPSKLEAVLFAIGENAITAMDAKGSLRIVSEASTLSAQKAASLELSAGDYLCFSVIDNGCGMDSEQLTHVIEPYYSTTGGSGFGLSSVYGFMKNCEGALGIDSSLGQGTRVSLYFPLVNDEA